jgi:hypothetical protein
LPYPVDHPLHSPEVAASVVAAAFVSEPEPVPVVVVAAVELAVVAVAAVEPGQLLRLEMLVLPPEVVGRGTR